MLLSSFSAILLPPAQAICAAAIVITLASAVKGFFMAPDNKKMIKVFLNLLGSFGAYMVFHLLTKFT